MAIIGEEQLAHALTGMPYPARRWQIAWADFNCASDQVRAALQRLPELTYTHLDDVLDTLRTIERRDATIQPLPPPGV